MINIKLNPVLTDEECKSLKGKFLDDSSYNMLITEDCDCYREDGSILFKFRKKLLSDSEADLGFFAFKGLTKGTRGRGASAGPIDPNSVYWKKRKVLEISKGGWSAKYEVDGKVSKMKVQNEVSSNVVGYWSETKNLGKVLPCRLSHYTRQDFLKYEDGIGVIQKISNSYKNLNKEMYDLQMKQASINPDLTIGDTPFSTITVNRNFRTAVHQDSGDFGFGNLTVLENGFYHGGYFVIPKYGIAVDMRAGDHLCVDVHQYHGNTELYETDEDKILNDNIPEDQKPYNDNLSVGVAGLNNRYSRISLVCYLRDKLKECEMKIDPEYLKAGVAPETFLRVFFISKADSIERRQKYIKTNWNRVSSMNEGLHRIIKHQLKNVIIIHDNYELVKTIGNTNKFTKKDGITILNDSSICHEKGIQNLSEIKNLDCIYIPNFSEALKLIKKEKINYYKVVPPLFKKV